MNPIEAVRARLDGGRKWHKGDLSAPGLLDRQETPVCLLGATHYLLDDTELECAAEAVIETVILEQFADRARTGTKHKIANFNDHPDTTFADVEAVLDKAAVGWDERA